MFVSKPKVWNFGVLSKKKIKIKPMNKKLHRIIEKKKSKITLQLHHKYD